MPLNLPVSPFSSDFKLFQIKSVYLNKKKSENNGLKGNYFGITSFSHSVLNAFKNKNPKP